MKKKVLCIKLRGLGDSVILASSIETLFHAGYEIDLLLPDTWTELYQNDSRIRSVFSFSSKNKTRETLKKAFQFRKKYDLCLNFHASPKSAWISFFASNKRANHFHGHKDANRFSNVKIPGKGELFPAIDRDHKVLEAIGIDQKPKLPALQLSAEERKQAKQWFEDSSLKGPVLGIVPSASRPTKQWPMAYWAKLSQLWIREKKGSVVAFIHPSETQLATSFLSQINALHLEEEVTTKVEFNSQVRISSDASLSTVKAKLAQMSVVGSNDTGLKHLAVSLGIPTLTFFGPEHPFEWHPYPIEKHPFLFIEGMACRKSGQPDMPAWCGLNECTVQEHRCMTQIVPEYAFEILKRLEKENGKNAHLSLDHHPE